MPVDIAAGPRNIKFTLFVVSQFTSRIWECAHLNRQKNNFNLLSPPRGQDTAPDDCLFASIFGLCSSSKLRACGDGQADSVNYFILLFLN